MTASYKKLADGSWAVASVERCTPDTTATVTKASGETKQEKIGEFLYAVADRFVYRIVREQQYANAGAKVGDLSGVLNLFERAKGHLKRPAIVLGVPAANISIRINVAGDRAKIPGSLTVLDGDRDEFSGDRDWYGRILLDGTYQPSREARGTPLGTAIENRLREFAADPAKVAGEHGRLTGKCCFCNRALDDERSTAVGYGPVCATRYGLEWGRAKTTFVVDQPSLLATG